MYGRTDRRDFCTYILRIVNFSILVIIKKCYHIAKKVMVNVDKVCVTIYLTSFTKLSVRGTDIYSIVFVRRKYLTPCSFSDYISIIILFYYIIITILLYNNTLKFYILHVLVVRRRYLELDRLNIAFMGIKGEA